MLEEVKDQGSEEITKLEFETDDLRNNTFLLIDIIGDVRFKTHYAHVHEIDKVSRNDLEVIGLKISLSDKSKFVTVNNDKFSISKTRVKAIFPNPEEEKEDINLVYLFSGSVSVKKKCF